MAIDQLRPYHVRASGHASGPVEAWSGYPLQFAGQRRFGWQDEMAAELRDAVVGTRRAAGPLAPGDAPCRRRWELPASVAGDEAGRGRGPSRGPRPGTG